MVHQHLAILVRAIRENEPTPSLGDVIEGQGLYAKGVLSAAGHAEHKAEDRQQRMKKGSHGFERSTEITA